MGRCRDCASYPWAVQVDTTTFSATKCDESLKSKSWTPGSRDSENDCPVFKDKNAVVTTEEMAESEEISEQNSSEPARRGRRRRNG